MNEWRAIDTGKTRRLVELGAIEERIDDDDIGTGCIEALFSSLRIRSGDHGERALFVTRCFVSLEVSAGKRESIITHEEEFHEGIC